MKLTLSKQIELLCKDIAKDYDGWEYAAKKFQNKLLKHTDKIIIPRWTGSPISISSQPIVGIYNKKIEKIWRYTGKSKGDWSQFLRIMNPENQKLQYRARIKDLVTDNAEDYIRDVLNIGIRMLEENWDFSSEENLLHNLPIDDPTFPYRKNGLLEDDLGTRYCIARMLLGDFEYIQRFYNDEIETIRPKRKNDLEKLMANLPDIKAAYA
jgi:hypothetical protein